MSENNMDALFTGKPETVRTKADEERGPDLFLRMQSGQSSKVVFLGWLEGGRFDDQPILYSPILKRAFALPAHTVLLDKLGGLLYFTPVIIACTRAANADTGSAGRYTVQAFPAVSDDATLKMLAEALRKFTEDVRKLRGQGRDRTRHVEAGPGLDTVDAEF